MKVKKKKNTYVGCVTLTRELFPGGQGEGDLKIYSLLVFQEVAQFMNAILGTMAGLKCKVRHENLLFGLRMLFSFCFGWAGLGLKVFEKTF